MTGLVRQLEDAHCPVVVAVSRSRVDRHRERMLASRDLEVGAELWDGCFVASRLVRVDLAVDPRTAVDLAMKSNEACALSGRAVARAREVDEQRTPARREGNGV